VEVDGVDETEPEPVDDEEPLVVLDPESLLDEESSLLVDPESPLDVDESSLLVVEEPPVDVESSLLLDESSLLVIEEPPVDVESSLLLLDPVSYGSLDESSLAVVVVTVAVLLVLLADVIAGSSPAWTRNASTLNTATTLAAAPAAKLRTPGTRRRFFGAGSPFVMRAASTPALNPS
jgi:hypothetical protein